MHSKLMIRSLLFLTGLSMANATFAVNTVFSGHFNNEPRAAGLDDLCYVTASPTTQYHVSSAISVDVAGSYHLFLAYQDLVDTHSLAVYRGAFDPDQPERNRMDRTSVAGWILGDYDEWEFTLDVKFQPGEVYYFVVSGGCFLTPPTWALTFSGPGPILGGDDDRVDILPGYTEGVLPPWNPPDNGTCGRSGKVVAGPVLLRSTRYYFVDVSRLSGADVCLEIHSAAPDPGNPDATLIHRFDARSGRVDLDEGEYFLSVSPATAEAAGKDYFFLLVAADQVPMPLQPAMAGAWYDPAVPGQGLFIDVLEVSSRVFLGWFTFDLERPAADAPGQLGDPGQRWFTAQGPYAEAQAELELTSTTGGVFGRDPPTATNTPAGHLTLTFDDCWNGMVSYTLKASGTTGEFPIQRLGDSGSGNCGRALFAPVP